MRVVVLVVLVMLGGCLVLPVERTDTRVIESTIGRPNPGPIGALELRVDVVGRAVLVTARRARTCTADEVGTVETHREKHATMEGLGAKALDGDWWLVALVGGVMIATGTVSGLVTSVVLIVDGDGTTTQERTVLRHVASACPVAEPGIAIDVTFPAGQVVRATTNTGGVIGVPIADDAGHGFIVARAGSVDAATWYGAGPPDTTLSADQPQRGFAGVRDVLRACAAPLHVVGLVHVQLAIDHEGRVSARLDRGGPELAACMRDSLAKVRFPPDEPRELVVPFQL